MTTTARTTTENESERKTGMEPGNDSSATVAELAIPVAEFALGETATALDSVTFEIERVVADSGESLMPLLWVSGCEREALERAFDGDPSVEAFDLLADTTRDSSAESEFLYRMEWSERIEALVALLVEEGGTVLTARTANGRWHLRLLFPERAALARTYDSCEAAVPTVDVRRIYALDEGREDRFGLTDEQREALVLAFDHGYYEIPRGTMVEEFAEAIGISHQALSERLRRGHGNLVANAVVPDRGE
jgi:predicted DNA binding protein